MAWHGSGRCADKKAHQFPNLNPNPKRNDLDCIHGRQVPGAHLPLYDKMHRHNLQIRMNYQTQKSAPNAPVAGLPPAERFLKTAQEVAFAVGVSRWTVQAVKRASKGKPDCPWTGRFTTARRFQRWIFDHPDFVASNVMRPQHTDVRHGPRLDRRRDDLRILSNE